MPRVTAFLLPFFLVSGVLLAAVNVREYQEAALLFQEEKYDEAIEVLKRSLDANPDQAEAYNLLGLIYLKQDESIASAIGSFEQAVRLDPNLADAYFNLASTFAGAGHKPKLAAEYFKKTLEVDPNYRKAYFGLGWFTLTSLEDPVKAMEYFQKAEEYFPDFGEAHYGKGLCYVQMNKAPMALQSVSELRRLKREDLASLLEAILRGGKVSEVVPPEVSRAETSGNPPALSGPGPAPVPQQAAGGAPPPVVGGGDFSLIDIQNPASGQSSDARWLSGDSPAGNSSDNFL